MDDTALAELEMAWKVTKILAPICFFGVVAILSWCYLNLLKPAFLKFWEFLDNIQTALQGIREELRDLKHADQRMEWRVDKLERDWNEK